MDADENGALVGPTIQLRANSLTLVDSLVLSLANAAPTVGMAGALAALLAASGYGARWPSLSVASQCLALPLATRA